MAGTSLQADVLGGLTWRSIGPHRGGRVVAVSGVVGDPVTYYFGACAGGVWKSNDAGTTWFNVSDGFFNTAAVGALAVSVSDPNVIYVGTGETSIRGNVSHGDGVYKSTDAGKTWTNVGLKDTRHIGKIQIHPTNPDIVYVAALGHAWGRNDERGVYRSTDGGKTWEQVLFKSAGAGSHDISMDPNNPRIIYAAIWDAQRYPHMLRSGGEDSGLWRTRDGGDTWEDISRKPGLPKGLLGKIGVAASPAQSDRVWALIEAEDGALFRSDDGGDTWTRLAEDAYLRTRAWYYMHVTADPSDANTVWVQNYGLHKSIDGGKTFTTVPTAHGDDHALWIDPHNSDRMIEGNDGGAAVTFNGGFSWSSIFNQPTAQMYHVCADDDLPYRVYGSQQDNSAISVPTASVEGAIHERDWFEPGGGESGYIALKPDDPDQIVAGAIGSGAFNGRLIHYNRKTGAHRNITVWPDLAGMGSGAIDLKYRFQWTFPIFFSQHDPDALYVAGNRIFRSTNLGASWEVISGDLTRNDPEKLGPSGGPITRDNTGAEAYCTIFALVESPHQAGLFWAGTDDGLVHISEDGGRTWENITPAGLPEWALISTIDLSVHDPGTAYLAATRYKHDDTTPYLYKTNDFGRTWTLITNGIPQDDFTRVLREDPNRKGLLYAGTETGVYISFDDGANWQRLGGNFPVVPVHDLILKNNDLVVATHGRSFWVLDDVTALHQLADADGSAGAVLFQSRPKVRMRVYEGYGNAPTSDYLNWRGAGTSVIAYRTITRPDGTTYDQYVNAGENPPAGIPISYWLKEKPSGGLTLTFKNADGSVIRSFKSKVESDDKDAKSDPGPHAPANAGLNRFVWDMRYPGAAVVEGQDLRPWEQPIGPLVVPGAYSVELTVGDATLSQPLTVLQDPRISATPADLQAQFDLLLRIRDALAETNGAVNKIRAIREQVEGWEKRFKGAEGGQAVLDAGKAVRDELAEIEDQLIDTHENSPLMFPSRLSEKINALSGFVDSSDDAPPQQAYDVLDELTAKLKVQTDRLQAAIDGPIAAFNAAVAAAGKQAVG